VAFAASAVGVLLAFGVRNGGQARLPASVERATRDPIEVSEAYVTAWTLARPELARALAKGRAAARVDAPPPWGFGSDATLEVREVHEGPPRRVIGTTHAGGAEYAITLELEQQGARHYVRELHVVAGSEP
jgi:hypothetical protein